jgi:hypothetical protein
VESRTRAAHGKTIPSVPGVTLLHYIAPLRRPPQAQFEQHPYVLRRDPLVGGGTDDR